MARNFILADCRFFFVLRELIVAIFRKYQVPIALIILSFLSSICNRNAYVQTKLEYAYPKYDQISNSLYTVLFVNERGKL